MTHTPGPTTEAILAALPGLAPHARDAVLLHPRRAEPDRRHSSIGGPRLWGRRGPVGGPAGLRCPADHRHPFQADLH
ncbi:hypothetical protein GCM10010524_19790 [Streptomyces mexicanus]